MHIQRPRLLDTCADMVHWVTLKQSDNGNKEMRQVRPWRIKGTNLNQSR
jgi:hypothetical protein